MQYATSLRNSFERSPRFMLSGAGALLGPQFKIDWKT